jgi:hypothetical protein
MHFDAVVHAPRGLSSNSRDVEKQAWLDAIAKRTSRTPAGETPLLRPVPRSGQAPPAAASRVPLPGRRLANRLEAVVLPHPHGPHREGRLIPGVETSAAARARSCGCGHVSQWRVRSQPTPSVLAEIGGAPKPGRAHATAVCRAEPARETACARTRSGGIRTNSCWFGRACAQRHQASWGTCPLHIDLALGPHAARDWSAAPRLS